MLNSHRGRDSRDTPEGDAEAGPAGGGEGGVAAAAQLERFCITPDLCEFVRSMTYSTFR